VASSASRSLASLSLAMPIATPHTSAASSPMRSMTAAGAASRIGVAAACCAAFQPFIASLIVVKLPPPRAARTAARVGGWPAALIWSAAA
jgi:hypothetical protein